MSHLVEQLLNAQNIPLLSFMNHNLNLIDQVPMPELLQENTDYNLNKYSHKYAPKRGITPKFNRQYQPDIYSKEYNKRHRRKRNEIDDDHIYSCECGKTFLSAQALSSHRRTKHPEYLLSFGHRGRGRPRKYPQKETTEDDFELTKYDNFFTQEKRCIKPGINNDMKYVVKDVFRFLYESKYRNKLFFKFKKYEDNVIMNNLVNKAAVSWKPKNEKNCDEVFYEYLYTFKEQTNQKYFILILKFILLFRECFNLSKNRDVSDDNIKSVSDVLTPERLPDLCNEFYAEFLEPNDFFGLSNEDRDELVEIVQHFCIWLFKNEFTKSKLSLA